MICLQIETVDELADLKCVFGKNSVCVVGITPEKQNDHPMLVITSIPERIPHGEQTT